MGHFCGRESNCQILCRSLELPCLVFPKIVNFLFWVLFGVNGSVRQKNLAPEKSRVFPVRIMSFHKNTKRCDLIRSLNGAKAFPFQLNVQYPPYTLHLSLKFPLLQVVHGVQGPCVMLQIWSTQAVDCLLYFWIPVEDSTKMFSTLVS